MRCLRRLLPALAIGILTGASSIGSAAPAAPPAAEEARAPEPNAATEAEPIAAPEPATAPKPEPAPEPEPEPAAQPEPAPQPEPAAQPEPTIEPEPAPTDEPTSAPDTTALSPQRDTIDKRTTGLGLLAAGSGFVAIGTSIAVIYGVSDQRCGGSCIGGALTAGLGVAGVVIGALMFTRADRQRIALTRDGRVLAQWLPARGVRF